MQIEGNPVGRSKRRDPPVSPDSGVQRSPWAPFTDNILEKNFGLLKPLT